MPSKQFRSKFSSTGRTGFVSGYQITQNQGGGEKKAGLIPSVGNGSWANLFKGITNPVSGRCCSAGKMAQTLVFTRNVVRPANIRPQIKMG
jgi:hypothetical protein